LRGVLTVNGSEPLVQLVLRPAHGASCTVREQSPLGLAAAQGLELTLWGALDDASTVPAASASRCGFIVQRYAVRAVNGIAALSGTLCTANGGFALRLADGAQRTLAQVPESLRGLVGTHVYWAGSTDSAPVAYGVLAANRWTAPPCE
jgi:hypothetical protein